MQCATRIPAKLGGQTNRRSLTTNVAYSHNWASRGSPLTRFETRAELISPSVAAFIIFFARSNVSVGQQFVPVHSMRTPVDLQAQAATNNHGGECLFTRVLLQIVGRASRTTPGEQRARTLFTGIRRRMKLREADHLAVGYRQSSANDQRVANKEANETAATKRNSNDYSHIDIFQAFEPSFTYATATCS